MFLYEHSQTITKGNFLAETPKEKSHTKVADLPEGIRELVAVPKESQQQPILLGPSSAQEKAPAHPPKEQPHQPKQAPAAQERPKTAKEKELDSLIAERQAILVKLKEKNPLVLESRKKISALIPAVRGKGSSRTQDLMAQADKIEFSIATEADTPKKEKELLKKLREIKASLSNYKELDAVRHQIDHERDVLRTVLSDIHSLENDLAAARKKCDDAYTAILAERKAAYEGREKKRGERKEKLISDLKERVYAEKRKERDEYRKQEDAEMQKYFKNYDDTLSMEEIVVIEKKEKKKKEE